MNLFDLEKMLLRMNEEVARHLQIPPESTIVLDLGCGYCSVSRYLAARFPNARFFGVNRNTQQLALAQKMNAEAGFAERISTIEADFQAVPLPGGFADLAFALESASFAAGETKAVFLQEVARTLKSGGRFVVVDGFRKHDRPMPPPVAWLHRHCLRCWELGSLADIHGFEKELQRAGFGQIVSRDISWNLAPSLMRIPLTVLKLLFLKKKGATAAPSNYPLALTLTFMLALSVRHFGYYLVTCVKS